LAKPVVFQYQSFVQAHYCRKRFEVRRRIDSCAAPRSFSPVDVFAIPDLHNLHNQHGILNRVKDAKAALADAIALKA